MDSSDKTPSGVSFSFGHSTSRADGIITQQKHKMYNPVTPDVSPPPSRMSQFATPQPPKSTSISSEQPNDLSHLTSSWKPKFNLDTTAVGDISAVTSMDIQEMENVRNHLQTMLKTTKAFNIDNGYEDTSYTATEEDKGDATNTSATSVDTAAFLQKLLPNSSPLEELRVHFADQSRGTTTDQSGLTRQTNESTRFTSLPQPSDRGSAAANRSLMSENSLLRDHLEKEKFRRKHCEQQIQELHSKLLEVQQDLAVAVSSERKKDVMVEQLDKTLAKVVEGWKRHENEKLIVINTLKQERDIQEQAHQKQQEMLLQFEKELEKAVEALTREQDRATEAEKEKQEVINKQAKDRQQLLQVLAKEKEKVKTMDEEKLGVVKEKEQAQHKYMEAQKQIEELSEKNLKMRSELKKLKEDFNDSLNSEKKKLDEERMLSKESKDGLSSLQKKVQRLEMEMDTTNREKESLKMEMSLMQARHEASKAKEETERQAELEKQMTQRLEDLHQHMSHSESEMRESHRKQIQETNNKHKEEMHQQLEKFHEEIKKKDSKLKTTSMEYEERLVEAQDRVASLGNHRQQLENQRQNLTIRMHQMMQAHCDEALHLLSSNRSSPPGKSTDAKVNPSSKISPRGQSTTSRWQHQVSPTSSVFTNPVSTHSSKETNSYKPFTPSYPAPISTAPIMNYQVHYSSAPPRPSKTTSIPYATQSHDLAKGREVPYATQSHDLAKGREVPLATQSHDLAKGREVTRSQYPSQNQESLLNKDAKPTQHYDQKHTSGNYNGTQLSSIAAPAYPLSAGYQDSSIFSSYLTGTGTEVNEEMTRSGLNFVPLKTVQDDQDTESVISALHGSPDSGPLSGTGGYPEMDYQFKVTSSGGSNGTLMEQDLEESRMSTTVSPENQQSMRIQGHNISEKLHEQEQRQTELNHYVNMLLKRSPGHPYDEGLEQLSEPGLMTIPSSAVQGYQSDFFPAKAKTQMDSGYPPSYSHHISVIGDDAVTKDIGVTQQSHQQAFAKTTVPAPFTIHQPQGPQFQHSVHPHTPPRREKDPIEPDTSQEQPSLTPKQMKQLSKLLSLMAEGQPGVQVPTADQLFGVFKGMQKGKPSEPRTTVGQDNTGLRRTTVGQENTDGRRTNTKAANLSHVKRNLDTSFSPRKQKPHGPLPLVSGEVVPEHLTNTDQHKTRPPSTNSAPPPRAAPDQGVPRHQVATKASSKHVVSARVDKRPIPPPTGKQAKASTAWR